MAGPIYFDSLENISEDDNENPPVNLDRMAPKEKVRYLDKTPSAEDEVNMDDHSIPRLDKTKSSTENLLIDIANTFHQIRNQKNVVAAAAKHILKSLTSELYNLQ